MALWRNRAWVVVLGVTLAACGGSDNSSERTPIPSEASTFALDAATPSPARTALEREYERLRDIQNVIAPVWENLAVGAQVRCGVTLETLSPAAISAEGDSDLDVAAAHLRGAAVALDQSVRLWQTECANPRPEPPGDVINRGRLAVREAGTALDAAAVELGLK